jgi:hypothetical protein
MKERGYLFILWSDLLPPTLTGASFLSAAVDLSVKRSIRADLMQQLTPQEEQLQPSQLPAQLVQAEQELDDNGSVNEQARARQAQ